MVYNPFRVRQWRLPKIIIALWIAELVFTIPALALFGIADPNLYRTKLWQDGSDNGFNSSPSEILYAYANHRPISTPLVWSQFITSFNVVISVLSVFVLLVKGIMFIMRIFLPIISFAVHGALTALFAYSVHAQSSSDMSDPKHPQPGAPWYLAKSCSVVHARSNYGYCQQAKAAFGVTIILMLLFAANTCWAVWCLVPRKEDRLSRRSSTDSEENIKDSATATQRRWDQFDPPPTARSARGFKNPMTPRTKAYNALGGGQDLPLRNLK